MYVTDFIGHSMQKAKLYRSVKIEASRELRYHLISLTMLAFGYSQYVML